MGKNGRTFSKFENITTYFATSQGKISLASNEHGDLRSSILHSFSRKDGNGIVNILVIPAAVIESRSSL